MGYGMEVRQLAKADFMQYLAGLGITIIVAHVRLLFRQAGQRPTRKSG
jgi:hypothetical protein